MVDSKYNGFNENNPSEKDISFTNRIYATWLLCSLGLIFILLDVIGFGVFLALNDKIGMWSFAGGMTFLAVVCLIISFFIPKKR